MKIKDFTYRLSLWSLFLTALLVSGSAVASPPGDALARFRSSRGLSPAKTAVLITDLKTGNDVVAFNDMEPLIPASILKAVTTATLLDKSGPDRSYETEVFIDGPVSEGVLEGNIIVVGSGDPSLGTDREPFDNDFIGEIIEALKQQKITTVSGRIIINKDYFTGPSVPPSWGAGDLKTYYGTGVHGFNYQRNASGNKSISNPASVFVSRLKTRLGLAGIKILDYEFREGERKLLTTHSSPAMEDIMRSCMMRSDNMYAESLLRTFGRLSGGNGDVDGSARLETEFWKRKRAPMAGVNIVDGSGLSRDNRVTARFMDYVLESMKDNVEYASFFPLAGQEGTLKKFLAGTPLEAYVAMKTGSMNGIQCYAGYVLDDDFAPTHSVVFIMNSIGDRGAVRTATERLLLDLFNPSSISSESVESEEPVNE